jgi:hypothetical protein
MLVLSAAGFGGALLALAGALFVASLWMLAMLALVAGAALMVLASRRLPRLREVPFDELMAGSSLGSPQAVAIREQEPEELYVDPDGPFGWMRAS